MAAGSLRHSGEANSQPHTFNGCQVLSEVPSILCGFPLRRRYQGASFSMLLLLLHRYNIAASLGTDNQQRMNQAELVPESFSVWILIKDIAILFSRGRASIALHEISSSSLTHSRQLLDANSHTVSSSHTRNKPRSKPCWDAHPITRRPTRDICRPRRSRPPKELAVREAPVAASVLGIDRCSGAGQDYSCRLWKLPDFVRDK